MYEHAKNQLNSSIHSEIRVHDHPKIIKVIFNFAEFASACKKSAQVIHSFLQYSRFAMTLFKGASPILTMPRTQKLLAILKMYHQSKNQFVPLILLWDIANLKVLWRVRPHPFLTTSTPIFFYQLLISGVNIQKSKLLHHFVLETYLI